MFVCVYICEYVRSTTYIRKIMKYKRINKQINKHIYRHIPANNNNKKVKNNTNRIMPFYVYYGCYCIQYKYTTNSTCKKKKNKRK